MGQIPRSTERISGFVNSIYIIKRDMFVCLFVYLFIYLYVADGRPNGWADQDQTWHRDSC